MPDLESVKPERFICGECGGIGHFFMRLRARSGARAGRVRRWTDLRFYCMDCVTTLPSAWRLKILPVNETEA